MSPLQITHAFFQAYYPSPPQNTPKIKWGIAVVDSWLFKWMEKQPYDVVYRQKVSLLSNLLCFYRCVLGNTTILAEFASEEEISRFFAQGQSMATPSSGWQTLGSSQSRMDQSHPFPSRASEPNQWNSSDLHSSSLWGGPNYSSSLWGTPSGTEAGRISSPSPITSFLPVDHLTGGRDTM